MKIIQRYITVDLIKSTFLALFVLVALFSFFSLIDQLEEAGKGHYGVLRRCSCLRRRWRGEKW